MFRSVVLCVVLCLFIACSSEPDADFIIRNGLLYDGTGIAPVKADIAILGDTILAIGDLSDLRAKTVINADGKAVAPGFINMLSWSTESLLEDGRAQSSIRQGVTLEIMGEGSTMGPVNDFLRARMIEEQTNIKYDIPWTTLGEYLEHLERKGIATNVASFVGATTVRINVLGYENRSPTGPELEQMKGLVRQAMREGALGVGSSLIYAPAFYASAEELIELSRVAAEYDGMYISHIRNESNALEEAFDEFVTIVRGAKIRGEIYHLKAAGAGNWKKMDILLERIEQERAQGLDIAANMYLYTAAATGLDAAMPPWVQEGGLEQWIQRLQNKAIRNRVIREMMTPTKKWENFYLNAGSPENILLIGFKEDSLRYLTGKSLYEVMTIRGSTAEETIVQLVIDDHNNVSAAYHVMSEENLRRQLVKPWMSFGSDASSLSPEGVFLRSNPHPRAYGNFARLLGKYVREEKLIPLEEAVRRLTSYPAERVKIERRGKLLPGYFADIVVFDPDAVQDHSTFSEPHQFSTGIVYVFVNGTMVLKEGDHTGATPGRVVRGPGWQTAR